MITGAGTARRAGIMLAAGALAGGTGGLLAVCATETRRLWGHRDDLAFADLVLACALAVLACAAARLLLAALLLACAAAADRSDGGAARLARALAPALCRALLGGACGAALLTGPPAAADPDAGSGPGAGPPGPGIRAHALPDPASGLTLPDRPLSSWGAPRRVRVRAGDSLWTLARGHLPATASDARVAAVWPRWYRANRARIGPDPHLIHPGTRLRVPPHLPG